MGEYEAIARTEGATKIYGTGATAVRALSDLTVTFERAHFSALMGPSGSGKSTLLHCMAGLDSLTEGKTFIGDVELGSLKEKDLTKLRRDRVGFIFQAFNLVPTLTAAENVTLPLDIAGRKVDKKWLDTVVDTIGIRDRMHHKPAELSGGQQQRVAAARALVSKPDVVFADEPTGNLDSKTGEELLDFLRSAVAELGQTIVMVTHDPKAAAHTDRVVFLADGAIVDDLPLPTADAVLDRMKKLDA